MKFFTDKTVKNDYLLIKIKDYIKMKDKSKWKEIFVDPGVYDLTKSDKFSWEGKINISEFLDSLPENHYFSWDYPGDMNIKYQELFLQKTWDNNIKYCYHPNFIVTAQYIFNHYWNFVKNFEQCNQLIIKSGILGLGNMCKYRTLNSYLKHTLDYAFSHSNYKRIHIYGLCLQGIPYADKLAKKYKIELSVDSMKWTFCFYETEINDRQHHFEMYMEKIKKKVSTIPKIYSRRKGCDI